MPLCQLLITYYLKRVVHYALCIGHFAPFFWLAERLCKLTISVYLRYNSPNEAKGGHKHVNR